MKLVSFAAKNVHGYMNFDMDFSQSPTILTGPNGSGKTTALRIMKALLTPSIRDLLIIKFSDAIIQVAEGPRLIAINARKTRDTLNISCSEARDGLEVPLSLLDEMGPEYSDPRRSSDFVRMLRVKYSENKTLRFISGIEAPLFLGLDRRIAAIQDEFGSATYGADFEASVYLNGRGVKPSKDSLAAGLRDMQGLVTSAYKRVRSLKDAQSERLRKKLLLTGFKYEEVLEGANSFKIEALSRRELVQHKEELMAALQAVGIDEVDARRELDPFFERVIKLSERVVATGKARKNGENVEVMLEVLLNRANLRRLRELTDAVREFNSKSGQLLTRFQAFVGCVNRFFIDSGKRIEVDAVGAIKVFRPDESDVPLDALSSGERQLLVMFGHVFFSSFSNKSNVIVIDEPELSLHLKWQESLLGEMMGSSSRAQFIVATHSPEIVGDLTDNCLDVRS